MALRKKNQPTKPRGGRTYRRTPVTTYYRSKNTNTDRSPFQKKAPAPNRRKYVIGAADLILLALLLMGLVYSLAVSPSPKVSATSLAYRPLRTYADSVNRASAGFKNRNKITFDENSLARKVRSDFPEVQSVQVELPFFSEKPDVKLLISPPALKLSGAGGIYVVDSQGVAVTRAVGPETGAKLPAVTDQSGFEAIAGRQVLSSGAVSFISTLVKQCRHAGVPVKSLVLPASPQEVDLRTVDQPYYVKFYLAGDVNLQTGQFLAARRQFAQTHQSPSQYLDVRVAGKIFYK